jgi:hypothetical protein
MKDLEQKIRNANPTLNWISARELEERFWGRLLTNVPVLDFVDALSKVDLPEAVAYVPSFESLERSSAFPVFRDRIFGEMSIQAGYCVGHNRKLNALEYHMGSELVVAGSDLVLLLDSADNVREGKYSPQTLSAIFVEEGQVIELFGRTLHFAPLEVSAAGFRAGIVLPTGTNLPLRGTSEGLLFAANKWLIAHPESPSAKRGAWVGIIGKNISLVIPNG